MGRILKLPEIYIRYVLGESALTLNCDMTQVHMEVRASRRQGRLVTIERQTFLPPLTKRILKRAVWETSNLILDDDDVSPSPIEASIAYRRMADVWAHRDALTKSETYDTIRQTLSATGRFWHKGYEITAPTDIVDLIKDCYLDILLSMAADGYRSDRSSKFATAGTGGVIIWRAGELISGPAATHRKAAAHILGMTSAFPLRITGLHRDWCADVGLSHRPSTLTRLPTALSQLHGVLARPSVPVA